MSVGDFDFADELFTWDEFVEEDALTYSGNTYDIVRHAETIERIYTEEGYKDVTVLPVDVLIDDFASGHPTQRAEVTLDSKTLRIQSIRTSSTKQTYRLNLVEEYDD